MDYTTADYLEQLQQDKNDLVNNLETKKITNLTGEETFTELVPKVLDIDTGLDWSLIGYEEAPQSIQNAYNRALEIKNDYDIEETSWLSKYDDEVNLIVFPIVNSSNVTNMERAFQNDYALIQLPLLNTSNVISMTRMFDNCRSLKTIPLLNTSNVADMSYMFNECNNLITIPLLNMSNVTTTLQMFYKCMNLTTIPNINLGNATTCRQMFYACTNLENIPIFDLSSINVDNGLQQMFYNCESLTDTSLNNILLSCINATSYSGTKTLKYIGINNTTYYPNSRIQALPAYQDFVNAGWSTGN